ASRAGAKIQLVWESRSSTFAHFALVSGNLPGNKYIDIVVGWAGKGALLLFALGYFKLAAFAHSAAAQAYVLSRLHHQATLLEAVAGQVRPVKGVRCRQTEHRPLLANPVFLGAHERVAARLIAVRLPAAVVNQRRRQARRPAQKRGDTPSQAQLQLLAWTLF